MTETRYRDMLFIRRFEERILQLYGEGQIRGTTHTCIGQEACPVALAEHVGLAHGDHIFAGHRAHGHYIAQTGDATRLACEIMGKSAGVCGGRGGSQHIGTPGFKTSGVQGGFVAPAVGIALDMARRPGAAVSVAIIGDGTLGQGVVYESLNMAALWGAPLLLVVEANGIAQTTPTERAMAGTIRARLAAFGLAVYEAGVGRGEPDCVFDITARAVLHVRARSGPAALVVRAPRLGPHSKGDDTRSEEEIAALWADDYLRGWEVPGVAAEVDTLIRAVFAAAEVAT